MILLDTDMMTTLHAPPSAARDRLVRRLAKAGAIAHDALLFSGNARDFAAVAALRFEPFRGATPRLPYWFSPDFPALS